MCLLGPIKTLVEFDFHMLHVLVEIRNYSNIPNITNEMFKRRICDPKVKIKSILSYNYCCQLLRKHPELYNFDTLLQEVAHKLIIVRLNNINNCFGNSTFLIFQLNFL